MIADIILMELNEENLKEFIKYKKLNINISENISSFLSEKSFYKALGMEYGLIYNYDSVVYGSIEELTVDISNILEARFFNDSEEIVIRAERDSIKGNLFIDKGEEKYTLEETFYLRSNNLPINSNYKAMKVRKYIDLDKDNQAYVFYLKPCSLVREG